MTKYLKLVVLAVVLSQTACVPVLAGYAVGHMIGDAIKGKEGPSAKYCKATPECGQDRHCYLVPGHEMGACMQNGDTKFPTIPDFEKPASATASAR